MIATPRPAGSRWRLAAAGAMQAVAGAMLLAMGVGALFGGRQEEARRSAVRVAETLAATLSSTDLERPDALADRLAGVASRLAATIVVERGDDVLLRLAPTGRITTSDASDGGLAAAFPSIPSGGGIAVENRLGGWQAAAAIPSAPDATVAVRMPADPPPSTAFVMAVAGGGLLLLLPLTVLAWRGRQRRDRLEQLAVEVEGAAEAASGSASSPAGFSDPDEELLPLAEAIHRLGSAWLDRVGRLESRLEETGGLLEALGSALVTLDRQHRVRSLNAAAAELLGVDRPRAVGRLLHELVRSPQLHRLLSRSVAGGDARPEEFPLSIADGEIVVQATCSRMLDHRGERGGLLLLMTDVTRIRRLENLRSDFAANVSHELRTPITNIKGYADTLVEVGFDDPEQSRNFLDIVRRNADRLAAIIEDLLTLAQLEGPDARQRLAPGPCNAARLADAVAESLGPAASARGIAIETGRVPAIEFLANAPLLEQALANLVSNAIKYAPEESTVHVGATADDATVTLAVRDEGPGIPTEHLERLFERFYRIDRARSRDRGGTGLGLSIVKHIAAVHDGRVEVDSEVGRGSEFRLVLPREPRLPDPQPLDGEPSESTPRHRAPIETAFVADVEPASGSDPAPGTRRGHVAPIADSDVLRK